MRLNHLFMAVLAAVILASCGGNRHKKFDDNHYPVMTVTSGQASGETTHPAVIRGVQDVEIRPKVSGFVTKVCVSEGQKVKAGQLLFVIDNATYQSAVSQARAAVNTATAQLNTARLTYQNSQKLHEKQVIGDYELSAARNTFESANAALAQARAALSSAQQMLSFCFVKSPASGVIGELPYKVGALVGPQNPQPMTTVSDNSAVDVYFSLDEKEILLMSESHGDESAAIAAMPAVKLRLPGDRTYKLDGKVIKMSGVINPATGTSAAIARFQNPERLLKSGGSATIVVPEVKSTALCIPQSATIAVQDKFFVYTVGKNNKVKYTEITIDPQNDGKQYVVTSGLKAGDRIVIKGQNKLTEDMEIQPISEAEYEKRIEESVKMGEAQGDMKKFKEVMTGKR